MSGSDEFLLSPNEERALHRRLLDGDPTAFPDLATTFLRPLIDWLVEKNSSSVPEDLCVEAAEDALIALGKSPASFKPEAGLRLEAYLRMSAQGDLRNSLRREGRHRQRELRVVELSRYAGKHTATDDDPSVTLESREEAAKLTEQIDSHVREGLSPEESCALDLLLQGERKTVLFAEALGLGHLPKEAQETAVKRVKDKLKKRIERGSNADGE